MLVQFQYCLETLNLCFLSLFLFLHLLFCVAENVIPLVLTETLSNEFCNATVAKFFLELTLFAHEIVTLNFELSFLIF